MLRNGEQLLLADRDPGDRARRRRAGADRLGLDLDGHRAGRRPHPGRAGPRRDVDRVHVAGHRDRLRAPLRRDQAPRRLPAPPARPAARQGAGAAQSSRPSSSWCSWSSAWRWAGSPSLAARRPAALAWCWRSAPRPSRRSGCSSPACCAPRRRSRCQPRLPAPHGRRRRRAADLVVRRASAGLIQWLPSGALGEAMRAALVDADIDGRALLVLARLGRRSAPPSPPGPSGGNDRVRTLLDRLARPGRLWPLAVANLVANIGIVVTGGAVRLTGSGLGLPDLAAVHRGAPTSPTASWACTARSSSATGC